MAENHSAMGDLVQLVYASAATVPFTEKDLDKLLTRARLTNESIDVTGVLLYQEGTFFQVLEGYEKFVLAIYDKIAMDPRHNNVLLLAHNQIEQRNFGDWSMGFLRDRTQVEDLPGFVNFFDGRTFIDLEGDADRIRRILDGFRRGRWRRCGKAMA